MDIVIREAKREDLEQIVKLLSEDILGSKREVYSIPLDSCYIKAFDNIKNDNNSILLVASLDGDIIGNLQITFIQYLSHRGSKRALIENVRVSEEYRCKGIGTKLMYYAIDIAKKQGCAVIQLMSDKKRTDAHRFYKRLGFNDTHEGMKLILIRR